MHVGMPGLVPGILLSWFEMVGRIDRFCYCSDENGEAGRPSPLKRLHWGLLAHP